jgi:hypothetical protein
LFSLISKAFGGGYGIRGVRRDRNKK